MVLEDLAGEMSTPRALLAKRAGFAGIRYHIVRSFSNLNVIIVAVVISLPV